LLFDVLNPECIVLGDIFVRAGNLLWPAAAEVIEREALPRSRRACTVVPVALGEAIRNYAAVAPYAQP
jgi:glucokinase